MSFRLLVLLLPLALDTFAVSALVAATGLDAGRRRRASIVFVAFEAGMPLVGLALGLGAAHALGGISDWVAFICIAGVGGWLLIEDEGRERERTRTTVSARWGPLLALGVAISLDELAIGFTFGLLDVSIGWALALIAAQALVASQLGFRVGARSARWIEPAERGAGVFLLVVAAVLVVIALR